MSKEILDIEKESDDIYIIYWKEKGKNHSDRCSLKGLEDRISSNKPDSIIYKEAQWKLDNIPIKNWTKTMIKKQLLKVSFPINENMTKDELLKDFYNKSAMKFEHGKWKKGKFKKSGGVLGENS